MGRSIADISDEIIRGYVRGKSAGDDDMLDLLIELGDRVEEIKTIVAREVGHRAALEAILRQPQETMSDGKAVAAMVRIARAALGENGGK